jgi:protein-S-isoprenylcysteine O-methyltransferase Ste14
VKLLLKTLLFTVLVPGTVAVYVPMLITHGKSISMQPEALAVGILLLGTGVFIYCWTVWDFAIIGRGTPLPIDAPKQLVARGLYRYTQDPMYSGVILVILGWAGVFTDKWLLLYAMGVGIAVHSFVVYYEEPKLEELFGEEYIAYRRSVGRWVPRNRGI